MKRRLLGSLTVVIFVLSAAIEANEPLDRRAIVERHNIKSDSLALQIPIGNGQFCFNVDGTGLQTFGGSVIAHDGWFVEPIPEGFSWSDVPSTGTFQQGRNKGPDVFPEDKAALRRWMFDNPRRANLARIRFAQKNGVPWEEKDVENLTRTTTLWTGVHSSSFAIRGVPVAVETCLGDDGIVAVRVESELLKSGDLEIVVDFPYPSIDEGVWVGWFDDPERPVRLSELTFPSENSVSFSRILTTRLDENNVWDSSRNVRLGWNSETPCRLLRPSPDDPNGRFRLIATGNVCEFFARFAAPFHETIAKSDEIAKSNEASSPFVLKKTEDVPPDFADLTFDKMKKESEKRWDSFWTTGGAIDLSGSRDPRWFELERRIVLSQFEMRTNSAGEFPSPETGLLGIDYWRGQFHMEMVYWHLAHYYLWGRSKYAEQGVSCYFRFKEKARDLAKQLGYQGSQWQKSVGPDGRTAPWEGNQVLLWKQPHPILFAELEYRIRPTDETLEKWADIIEETAEFMADYPTFDGENVAHLDPVMPPSEQGITKDTVFDLAYWRWGLDKANEWRQRRSLPRNPRWDEVRNALAPLPIDEDGFFVHSAQWFDSFTKRNWEHPDLIGVLGMLPPIEGVDFETATRTTARVVREWQWDRCWGWDFPWTAMAAARTGQPELAVEILLNDSPRNRYDERGVNVGGPCPYLPGNGGLLYAVAMMCAGWDRPCSDSTEKSLPNAPGFPNDGNWNVRWEGLQKAL